MKKLVKFPEVLFFQEGPGVRNTQYTSEGVKLLNVANLVDGRVDLSTSDRFISRHEAYGKYKHFLCDDGDFIIASSGIKVEYVDKKMGFVDESMLPLCMNTSTIRFKVLNNKELNIRYFMYYLKSKHFKAQLGKQITGSAQLNYGPSHLKDMTLPMTDISIQNNIVNILDKIQNIINTSEIMLEKLDKLVKARFIEMFGDPLVNSFNLETKPMTEVCDIIDGDRGKNYPTADDLLCKGYCLFLNAKNVTTTGFNFDKCIFINKEKDDILRKGKLKRGDVVLTTRGTIGNLAFYGKEIPFDNVRINSGMVILRMKQDIVDEVYFIENFKIQLVDIKEKVTSGSAQPQLPISTMSKINILLPKMKKQQEFSTFVEQVNKSKVEVQMALDEAQLLFDSLMQKYFG